MSTPVYRIPPKVIALLHERGETVESIATKAGTGRAHASQVMANKPGRGHQTRKKLAAWLTSEELQLLGWDAFGRLLPCGNPVAAIDTDFGRVHFVHHRFSTGNVPCSPSAEPEPLTQFSQ